MLECWRRLPSSSDKQGHGRWTCHKHQKTHVSDGRSNCKRDYLASGWKWHKIYSCQWQVCLKHHNHMSGSLRLQIYWHMSSYLKIGTCMTRSQPFLALGATQKKIDLSMTYYWQGLQLGRGTKKKTNCCIEYPKYIKHKCINFNMTKHAM